MSLALQLNPGSGQGEIREPQDRSIDAFTTMAMRQIAVNIPSSRSIFHHALHKISP
jgi:hypothetical protein